MINGLRIEGEDTGKSQEWSRHGRKHWPVVEYRIPGMRDLKCKLEVRTANSNPDRQNGAVPEEFLNRLVSDFIHTFNVIRSFQIQTTFGIHNSTDQYKIYISICIS